MTPFNFNDFFDRNMDDVLLGIFSRLPVSDLRTARTVCPAWRDFVDGRRLIRAEVRRRWLREKPTVADFQLGSDAGSAQAFPRNSAGVSRVFAHRGRIYILDGKDSGKEEEEGRIRVFDSASLREIASVPNSWATSLVFCRDFVVVTGTHRWDLTRCRATVLERDTLQEVSQEGNRNNFGQNHFFLNDDEGYHEAVYALAPPGSEYSLFGQVPSGHYMRGTMLRMDPTTGVLEPAEKLSFMSSYEIVGSSPVSRGRIFLQCLESVARLVDLEAGRLLWECFAPTPPSANLFAEWKGRLWLSLRRDRAVRAHCRWGAPDSLWIEIWSAVDGSPVATVERPWDLPYGPFLTVNAIAASDHLIAFSGRRMERIFGEPLNNAHTEVLSLTTGHRLAVIDGGTPVANDAAPASRVAIVKDSLVLVWAQDGCVQVTDVGASVGRGPDGGALHLLLSSPHRTLRPGEGWEFLPRLLSGDGDVLLASVGEGSHYRVGKF